MSGVSASLTSAGERDCDGGRNPTVHAGGSAMVSVKPPTDRPVGLLVTP